MLRETQVRLKRLGSAFLIPHHANIALPVPPNLIISAVLIVISFGAYLFGPPVFDDELRQSFLMVFFLSALLVGLHFLNQSLARWLVSLIVTVMVFWLSWIWQNPTLLTLFVVPVILAAVAANVPAILLTALVQSLIITSGWWLVQLGPTEPRYLLVVIWLVAALAIASYLVITDMLARANNDYSRLQALLNDSRSQQQKLSQALDDLAHANRQLSLLYDKNISLRRIAEEATEAKSTYIAKVSHEIRTPLNMILGITESIIENREDYGDDLPSDLEDDIRIIRRNSEHLLSLVNDVLDLTRAESSQMNLRKDWVEIESEVEKSLDIVLPLAKKKNLRLDFHHLAGLPPVFCDRTRIRQVILNLLSNAVRYTEHGEIVISAAADDRWLRVIVRDTGPGILPADVERIFEPFYRGQQNPKQETLGTGLGLSVSRQIIELHGGKIEVESQVGLGSIFSFSLPLVREPEYTPSPARFINEQWAWVERKGSRSYNFRTPQKKRIVVYGSEDAMEEVKGQLSEDAEFAWTSSLEALVNEVNRLPAHLVLINDDKPTALMELVLRVSEQVKDTPVIGSSFSLPREKIARTGAMEYIQKPFENQHLRETVARVSPYPRRILIVDDNIEVQRLMVRILRQQDDSTEFLLAETSARAYDLIERKPPDLILLDLLLPDGDGWQLLQTVRDHSQWCDIPVILVSASDLNDSPPQTRVVMYTNGSGVTMNQFTGMLTNNLQQPGT